jgi:hypothetical protein
MIYPVTDNPASCEILAQHNWIFHMIKYLLSSFKMSCVMLSVQFFSRYSECKLVLLFNCILRGTALLILNSTMLLGAKH